jgi:superfamily I DNA/RNA helicase
MLLVDEAQDLNRCQQHLARKAGKRLIFCGDPKQSIYGFAGADCESMSRLERELGETPQGVRHLSLTVTRRCSKSVVKEAQKYVPDFSAFVDNPEGKVSRMALIGGEKVNPNPKSADGKDYSYQVVPYREVVEDGDMILCRCNAPLVSECFRFLREGRKANIQGRDVGQGLINTIKKMPSCKSKDPNETYSQFWVSTLISDLDDWLHVEQTKERAKRNPQDSKLINLQDRHDCILEFCATASYVKEVIDKINAVFSDEAKGNILLSSVHKAKGLEAKRVFILMPEAAPMPHPMARSPWEREQEINLLYVAITRAIEELVFVS